MAGTVAAMNGPPPGVVDLKGFAAMVGIDPGSLTRYRYRGDAPAPDGYVGGSPWWFEARVAEWIAQRPGRWPNREADDE